MGIMFLWKLKLSINLERIAKIGLKLVGFPSKPNEEATRKFAWWKRDRETPVHNTWTIFTLPEFINKELSARGRKGKVKIIAR